MEGNHYGWWAGLILLAVIVGAMIAMGASHGVRL